MKCAGSNLAPLWAPAMETYSEKCGQDNSGHDTSLSGALTEPVLHRSGDRYYPPGMGLRPKACPRSRKETSPNTRSERPGQGQVDQMFDTLSSYGSRSSRKWQLWLWCTYGVIYGCSGCVDLPDKGCLAGYTPWSISQQRQNSVMVGRAPSGAQMWEALFHVWSTLQSHLA